MPETLTKPVPAPLPPGLHSKDDDLIERRSLRDYYIIIRERLWIALPLALLVAVSIGYYQAREVPLYRSTATMQFERPEKVVLNEQVVDQSIQSDVDLNTYLQILNSGRLRSKVVESLKADEVKLLQRPYLKGLPSGVAPPPAGALVGGLSVGSMRNSFLISISVVNRDPEGASLLANRYMDQFIQHLMETGGGKNEFAVDYLTKRAEELRKEYEAAESRLQEYKQKNDFTSFDDSLNTVNGRVRTLDAAVTGTRIDRIDLEVYLKQVDDFKAEGRNLLEITFILNYGSVSALKAQLAELSQRQAVLNERYLERHPRMIDLSNAMLVAREQLDKAIELAIADLRSRLEKVRASEQSLQRELNDAQKDARRLDNLSAEYKSLENQAQVAKKNYSEILDRLNQTQTSKSLENIPVHPLDRATPSSAPFSPDQAKIIRTCVGVGVLVFLAAAIGLGFIDDRIKSAWDVESFINAPLLGIIPSLDRVPDDQKHTLAFANKITPGGESFLSVYSAVKIQSRLDFPKSLLVTSTIPGEGKTLISCNLAGSFARHGRTTLLIDCDMRRPMLHRHFKLPNSAGLIPWFEAGGSFTGDLLGNPQLGITKIADNLSLLCSGGHTKSPTELLESPLFGQLLVALRKHFELIVVDSPPLGAVTDSLLIAEHIDEIVYVCRFNRAYRKHIKLYIKSLRQGKNEILGVVLNGLSPRRIEYYSNYRYYRSYKKYYGAKA